MPELPEVETVVRELSSVLPGRTITCASLTARDLYRRGSRSVRALVDVRVVDVTRTGKAIMIHGERSGGAVDLVVHLGMTGQLQWRADDDVADALHGPRRRVKHLHARLCLTGGELWYVDPRRFGYFFVGDPAAVRESLAIGPDPFGMRADRLARTLTGRTAPVKSLLLDQRLISGLGNIYVDESLFLARVHPLTPGASAAARAGAILDAARRVLRRAIRMGGTTIRDYRRPDGSSGAFQRRLAVYGRDGEPCPRCGSTIERIVVAQRGTHFCPRCQRRPTRAVRSPSAGRSRRAVPRRGGYTPSR